MTTDDSSAKDPGTRVNGTAWHPEEGTPVINLAKEEETGKKKTEETAGDENDRFLHLTKKVTGSMEKGIVAAYKSVRAYATSDKFNPRASTRRLDKLVEGTREVCIPAKFDALSGWFAKYGHAGLLCAQVLAVIFYFLASLRVGPWTLLPVGLAIAGLLIILQYTADKFLHAGDSLIKGSPSRLGSSDFLDCLALLMAVGGVLVLVLFLVDASWGSFFVGIGGMALCWAIAYIALNPSMVNTSIDAHTTAGEEAIGILSFLAKAIVRMAPIGFGIGSIIGLVALLVSTFSMLFYKDIAPGKMSVYLIVFCACLPFFSYVFFTLFHLTIDIIRAIIVVPGKLDELSRNNQED